MASGQDVIDLCRSKIGHWRYTNDYPDRLYPEEYGGTDCSGMVRWAYGKFGYDVGTWTGDESHAGREIARGRYPSEIPWDEMLPGDLILMTAKYTGNFEFNAYLCHIELYCGGGTMIGHPGGWGPQEKRAQAWMEAYGCTTWMVRRVIEEKEEDVLATKEEVIDGLLNTEIAVQTADGKGQTNMPLWQAVSWAYRHAQDAATKADAANAKLDEVLAKLG